MAVTILEADAARLDELEALEKQCFSLPWTREQLAASLPDGQHEFLVAEEEGRTLGYVSMLFVLDEGYIGNVAVAPEHRRRGIASSLLKELLRRARLHALSFVTLEVRAGNRPAIALYERFGFETVGRRKNYYSAPVEDALIMTKYRK